MPGSRPFDRRIDLDGKTALPRAVIPGLPAQGNLPTDASWGETLNEIRERPRDEMRRNDVIHPLLVSRKPVYLLASLAVVIVGVGLALGYSTLSARLAPKPAADMQRKEDAGRPGTGAVQEIRRVNANAFPPRLSNKISRQASEWGMETCLNQIALVSDFLTVDQSYMALSQRIEQPVEAEAFTSTIAARNSQGIETVSTLVSTSVGQNECSSSYQTVASFAAPCETVHREHFPNFDKPLTFGDHVRAYANNQENHLFLLPVGEIGCTAIKTQSLY